MLEEGESHTHMYLPIVLKPLRVQSCVLLSLIYTNLEGLSFFWLLTRLVVYPLQT